MLFFFYFNIFEFRKEFFEGCSVKYSREYVFVFRGVVVEVDFFVGGRSLIWRREGGVDFGRRGFLDFYCLFGSVVEGID